MLGASKFPLLDGRVRSESLREPQNLSNSTQKDRPLDLPFSLDAQRLGVLIAKHPPRVVSSVSAGKIDVQEFNEDKNHV